MPKGDLCQECGRIIDSYPNDERSAVVSTYKANANFRFLFETCRSVLRGDLPSAWRRNIVKEVTVVKKCSVAEVYCVSRVNIEKRFVNPVRDKDFKVAWRTLDSPEGVEGTYVIFPNVEDIPPDMPWFAHQVSCETYMTIEDVFLDGDGCHGREGEMVMSRLSNTHMNDRSFKIDSLELLPTWADFSRDMLAQQGQLQLLEAERRRSLELATQGILPETQTAILETSGRFDRPRQTSTSSLLLAGSLTSVLEEGKGADAPGGKAGRGGGKAGRGGGGRGRGATYVVPQQRQSTLAKAQAKASAPQRPADDNIVVAGCASAAGNIRSSASVSSKIVAARETNPGAGTKGMTTPKKISGVNVASQELYEDGCLCTFQVEKITDYYNIEDLEVELAPLLMSNQGKRFPALELVMFYGVQIKRELNGVTD
jgi:hypothetical protein